MVCQALFLRIFKKIFFGLPVVFYNMKKELFGSLTPLSGGGILIHVKGSSKQASAWDNGRQNGSSRRYRKLRDFCIREQRDAKVSFFASYGS